MSESILIVDDEQMVRDITRYWIETFGHRALEAESAEQALDILNQTPVDLVIADVRMSGMDGLTLAQKLLEQDPDRPVLLMTGYADVDSVRRAFGIGIYDYFVKPVGKDDLAAGVRRALEHRRLLLENRNYQHTLEEQVARRTAQWKRALSELQENQAHLVQMEKMASLGQLMAGVAHELNNPIAFLYSNMERLPQYVERIGTLVEMYRRTRQAAGDSAEAAEIWREIKAYEAKYQLDFILEDTGALARESLDGARRVKETVENLKLFASPKSGNLEYIDLHEHIDTTLTLLHTQIKDRIVVEKHYGDLPRIACYANELNHVFMNLLANAAQAIDGEGRICITTRHIPAGGEGVRPLSESDNGGGWVEAEVADTGCGIPEEIQEKIFDPFFTTKPIGEGTGLGLSIVFNIVHKLGGTIDVSSQVGEGTMFTVRLTTGGTSP